MLHKIKRILIPAILACLFLVASYLSSAGQSMTSRAYLPLVSHDQSTWIGPYGGYLISIDIDPTNPQVVFAGSWGSGVFKSEDGSQNWSPSNRGLENLYINSLALDPVNPAVLYAGTSKNQVYKSIDQGNTWNWSGTGIQDQAIVYAIAIAVDPALPGRLYAGTSENGAYFSPDAGLSWHVLDRKLSAIMVQSIQPDPDFPNYIYLCTKTHGVFLSTEYP